MDVATVIFTKTTDSRDFLKTLYATVYLFDKTHAYDHYRKNGLVVSLYDNAEPHIIYAQDLTQRIHRNTVQSIHKNTEPYILKPCIETIIEIFRPRFLGGKSSSFLTGSEVDFSDARVAYCDKEILTLFFKPKDIYLQFTSARERLEIPSYLISTLQKLGTEKQNLEDFYRIIL
jgi:hypothetical protein